MATAKKATPKPSFKSTSPKMPGMGPAAKVTAKAKPKATPKPVVKVPPMNSKKIQDMLTGKTPVLLNGKKPKNAQELKEAIRQKTGIYPNTTR